MLAALIAGQANPHELARLARGSMRAKTSVLQEALTGHFTDHHAFMLGMMLARIDALSAQIDTLTTRIGEAIAPNAHQVAQLDEIPGIGITAAQDLLAEIGTDMSRFPTPGHLVSWAKFAPKARQSAGRSKAAATGKGNPWLGGTLGEAAAGAARTKVFLASRYKRIARRRGKQRALVAVGNSILVIAWHLLSDPAAHFTDLGPDWHDRLAPLRRKHQLITELERLFSAAQDVHDGDVRGGHVDSGIPGIWWRVRGHGGGDLVRVSRCGEQLAAVSVAGPVAGMAVPGPAAGDQLAGAGIRKRARPSRPASGQVIPGPCPKLRRAQSTAAARAFSASPSGDPAGSDGGPGG